MENVESYYDEKAEKYDAVFNTLYFKVYDAVTWRYLEPLVPANPDARVLDAGGGTGRWAVRIAAKGCKVDLMDCSTGMLQVARARLKESRLEGAVALKKCDITKTEYADETFDLVVCEHALFLVENPDVLLGELRRILKKGAPLVISAQNRYVQALSAVSGHPSASNLERAFRVLTGEEREWMTKDGKVEIYTWSPDEFRAMLERNGFRVGKMVGKGITMPLRIKQELFMEKKVSQDLFDELMRFELALCEKTDALALAGHMQATAFKL
ncbi:MAG: class I SAM-dependent methyltransferase [Candidatus Bathyarchaeia archaeon]